MPIKSISDQRRLQIIGKIRTGKKVMGRNNKERPQETSHFVLDPAIKKNGKPTGQKNPHIERLIETLGTDSPNELSIILPVGDKLPDGDYLVAQQSLRWYAMDKNGNSRVMCKGDGEWAQYKGASPVDGVNAPGLAYPEGYNRACNMETCPQFLGKKCKPNMKFVFWIEGYPIAAGLFAVDTSSVTAMADLNSTLEWTERSYLAELLKRGIIQDPSQFKGLAGVPLRLFRKEVPNKEGGVNYPLQIEVDVDKLTAGMQLLEEGKNAGLLSHASSTISSADVSSMLEGPDGEDFDENIINPDGKADVVDTETGEIIGNVEQVQAREQAKNPAGVDLKNDKELDAVFKELCELTGKKDTPKMRAITAKKFEGQPDQRGALLSYLQETLTGLKAKANQEEAKAPTNDTPAIEGEVLPPQDQGNQPTDHGLV